MEHLTAKVSCFARAWHFRNHPAHVFADTVAEALLGADYDLVARSMEHGIGFFLPDFRGSAEEGLRLIVERQLAPSVLGRSAFCERALEVEARLGCRQYAVLAAGYDTFAIRNPDAPLSVYELDLPEMLADKRRRTEEAGLASGAVPVPCDLSRAGWQGELIRAGFDSGAKAFASLLGISYYLDRGALMNLLAALGEVLCEGSAVCLDYPTDGEGREARTNRALARGADERMKARYAAGEMEALLAASGFLVCEQLGPRGMTDRFFAEYNRRCPDHRMEAPAGVGYIHAVRKEGARQ